MIYINFVEEPKYKLITENGYKTDDIIRNISRMDPSKRFEPGETLLFFDELQDYPEIATALKFFKIDGRFDVICSGSLLGLSYKRIESNSVGYKVDYPMYSMDFEEFLWAKGYDGTAIQEMLTYMENAQPFPETLMNVYSGLFLDYCILGGMPAVVREYIQKGTFEGTLDVQRQLLQDYKEDIRKYADGMDQTRILNVFEQIPVQLAKDNKKFQISKVAKGARFKDYRGCMEWLKDAGVIYICYCLNFPELPQKEDSTLEEDFFVRTRESLLPVEVKAKRGTAKSLRTLIQSERYGDIHCGIKFTAGNIGYSDGIYTFPYFCAFLLKEYLRRADLDGNKKIGEE